LADDSQIGTLLILLSLIRMMRTADAAYRGGRGGVFGGIRSNVRWRIHSTAAAPSCSTTADFHYIVYCRVFSWDDLNRDHIA
jgi:hypothetical protein